MGEATEEEVEQLRSRVAVLTRWLELNERTAREQARTWQTILESLPDGVIGADENGKFICFNPAARRIMGQGPTNGRPEVWAETYGIYRADGRTPCPTERLPLVRALRGDKVEDEDLVIRNEAWPEGQVISVSGAPIRGEDGALRGGVVVFRDVTERNRLLGEVREKSAALAESSRRAEEANRLKSEFLANMSHELRTPLNAVIGFAELMHDGKVGAVSDQHKEFLGDILASARHLLHLINDILDLAKIEAGKIDLRPEPVDVGALVGEVLATLGPLAASKSLALDLSVDPDLGEVATDPGKLKQVLYNYVSNAIKFTPDRGRVTVRALGRGDEFALEVEDTGVGIGRESLSRLFQNFQQLDQGTAKKHAGTGLGLALTRRIVEAQGGQVGVRSEPGRGSVFFAVLPRRARPLERLHPPSGPFLLPPRRAPTAPVPTVPAGRPAALVLVVDDDPASLRLVEATLGPLGYRCVARPDGASGLEAVAAERPAAIVLDLLMPRVDGFEFLERLRRTPGGRRTPVIVWTVKDLTEEEQRRLGASVHAVVQKGRGGSAALVERLRAALAGAAQDA